MISIYVRISLSPFIIFLLLQVLFIPLACVHNVTSPKPLAKVVLMTSRSMNKTNLAWKSQRNVIYTVMYLDETNKRKIWQPLQGATNIRGTGKKITLEDTPPTSIRRNYRLHMVPISKK